MEHFCVGSLVGLVLCFFSLFVSSDFRRFHFPWSRLIVCIVMRTVPNGVATRVLFWLYIP